MITSNWKTLRRQKSKFQEYMQRTLSLRPLGTFADNIFRAVMLTAVVRSASLRYARHLAERDAKDAERPGFYLGMILHGVRTAIGLALVGAVAATELVSAIDDGCFL